MVTEGTTKRAGADSVVLQHPLGARQRGGELGKVLLGSLSG